MVTVKDIYRDQALGSENPLVQVGHTLGGKPISPAQFDAMVGQIEAALDLKPDDLLLDMCCGNGLITSRLAPKVRAVVGVDLSAPLLDVARRAHSADNIDYVERDAREIGSVMRDGGRRFSKVLMFAALQHFDPRDFSRVLDNLAPGLAEGAVLFFGFVPDHRMKWRFYNTPRRALQHIWRSVTRTERMGHWWRREAIAAACRARGFDCTFGAAPPDFAYRFNARLEVKAL
jgi:SAM-dependent methyltransferase